MRFTLLKLKVIFKKSEEIIPFSSQISFFYGKISSGKSSIARLIDFCLGGELEDTPALKQELVKVQLLAQLETNLVLFERNYKSDQIQVNWENDKKDKFSVIAPKKPTSEPIWGDNIYNLSDLIFYLLKTTPIKVKRSKQDVESPLVRLSFRDIMWYCYLDQDHLDSSFFRLEDTFKRLKSRDVMRFVIGFYTENLNDLEVELEENKQNKKSKEGTIEELKKFLEKFGFNSISSINKQIEELNNKILNIEKEMKDIRGINSKETHIVDELREILRTLNGKLKIEEQIKEDLIYKINEEESLKAEMISAKFKLTKHKLTLKILNEVKFELCPECGNKLDRDHEYNDEICPLCKNRKEKNLTTNVEELQPIYDEIDMKIKELDESIKNHNNALENQIPILDKLRKDKNEFDNKLNEELKDYDSKFLAQFRNLERNKAIYEEKVNNLNNILKMPKAVEVLEEESKNLTTIINNLKNKIENEEKSFVKAYDFISEIENTYINSLKKIKLPGINENDIAQINLTTWIPWILPSGEASLKYSFKNAGSGGKKTLLNVCYALTIHIIASQNNLPLPTFLIIDTPMKNIGKEINKDIFIAFYKYLYDLAEGLLANTQFIIIDKEYIPPDSPKFKIYERLMTPDDEKHPPLIPYYRGP